MTWWPFSPSQDSPRQSAIRSGAEAPTRAERAQCWSSRDAYFACLDRSNILDPDSNPRACPGESRALERDCARAWVEYFKKWRVAEARKRERIDALRKEGAVQVPMQSTFVDDGDSSKGPS
ncbi:hypothetical protein L249_0115 [Ophiocordyceps polyrhachis-furcata BCC 54312]|uniref:Cytochrome c oxidase assembly factor 6 n=1 Tax=Ophiocordyceps polyrhachis-furcata BCC 54312 TaxID=1330021 RepID=A0A367LFR5_9HYPO|nr:hypothetical protein L249_0115 [Ophiocordyceps polyrhachis-furcata BCC 54312]